MSKRRKILLALVGVVILGVVLWAVFTLKPEPDPEPSYKGKPLSFWVDQYHSLRIQQAQGFDVKIDTAEPAIAIRHFGTNALPYLLKWISYEPPPKWKTKFTSYYYSITKRPVPNDNKGALWAGSIYSFKVLGANARPAVPLLIISLQNNRELVAAASATSLGEMAIEPDLVIPALTNSMQHSSFVVRCASAEALRHFPGKAAVPALLVALKDPVTDVRFTALSVLKTIDPEALKRATQK